MRIRGRAALPLLLALLTVPAAAEASTSQRARLGRCVSFVKRLQEKGVPAGIVRQDLYEGLTGWIAMKARISPGDVEALGAGASPEAAACEEVGLAPEPLLALERAVGKVPAERLRSSAEACLAALRVLDSASTMESVTSVQATQTKALGKMLGYVAKDRKPQSTVVEARAEALRREAGPNPFASSEFVQAIQGCEPLGVDVDLLRRTHGAS